MLRLYNLKYVGDNKYKQDMNSRFIITETNYIEYCRFILNKVKIIEAEMYIDKPDEYIVKHKKLNHGVSQLTNYMQYLYGIEYRIFDSGKLFDSVYGNKDFFLKFCRNHLQNSMLNTIRDYIIDGYYAVQNLSLGYNAIPIEEFNNDYEIENSVDFDINISKWRGGKHYYAKVCGIDVVDGDGDVKWNSYSEAWRVTEWFMRNNDLVNYGGVSNGK